jgi:hypothetical protein
MANRLNVANIGYDDNNDALTIASDGTISAGTLGSGVVFPAGHVIQTVNATVGNINTSTTSTSLHLFDIQNQITITSGNYVRVTVHFIFQSIAYTSNSIGYSYLKQGTVASPGSIIARTESVGSGTDNNEINFSRDQLTLDALDTSPNSTTPSYVVYLTRDSAGTSVVYLKSAADEIQVILQEIQS